MLLRSRILIHIFTTAAIVGSFVAATAQQPAPPDLIVTNANVVTMDEQRPRATALAVRDGRFVAVGSDAEISAMRRENTRAINARGQTLIPGLNDSHSHVVRQARFYHLELRWDGVDTLERALAMLREQARRTPKGQWVRVIGSWSPYQFKERRMPTVQELNAAAPDTPVLVLFLYSQGFLNRAGVEAMQITKDTQAPAGSRFELVEGGGAILHCEPNPAILYQAVARLPGMSPEEQVSSTLHWYRELNRFGLTSAADAGGGGHFFPRDYASGEALAKQNRINLRVAMYLFAPNADMELQDYQAWTKQVTLNANLSRARPSGYVYEGAGENVVASAADFENFMASRPNLSAEKLHSQLRDVATLLVRNQWPIRIHATYDETISPILDVFEEVFKAENFTGRWTIDHAEGLSDRSLERIKRLGGGVAIQDRMAFSGEYFVARYGKAAAASAPPLRKLVSSGIPVGAGTDGTRVSSYNPWIALYWMVSGRTVGGTELYTSNNRLTREEALRLFTVGSAWFSGDEQTKGRIAPGMLADFAVLNANYLTVPEERIKRIESALTVLNGDVVYAAAPFAALRPPALPPVLPAWSPVAHFGGYQAAR